jgi:hypothetical protein
MRLADHATLNFNHNIWTAVVFLDIEKAFHVTWHSGLLYKLLQLEFSTVIKIIASFLTERTFKDFVEVNFLRQEKIAAGMPQGSALALVLYRLYK